MRLGKFEHLEPKSVAEVCKILAEHGPQARVIAGGTDIVLRMKQRLVEPGYLVDIKQVAGLGEIKSQGAELRIGAGVTLTQVQQSPAVREQAGALVEAAGVVGATQLQNMGTLGGNICLETRCWYHNQSLAWRQGREACLKAGGGVCHMAKGSKRCYGLYSGDTAGALLALGAKVRLVSGQAERTVALEDFFVDDGQNPTVLRTGELLAEVIVPGTEGRVRGTYLKLRRREAIDFPIVGVGVAMVMEDGVCRQVGIGVTGVGSAPFVAKESAAVLQGQKVTAELIGEAAELAYKQAKPVSHMEVSAAYRKRLVRTLVADALSKSAGLA